MHVVNVKRDLQVDPEKVWQLIDDFGAIELYHPLVKTSETTNGQTRGLGAERVCNFYDGNSIYERITEYDEGKSYVVEIFDTGKIPLKTAMATMKVNPVGENSEVDFTMRFEPKFGLVGWIMGKLMMEGQFRKILNRVLQGMEDYLKTGTPVNKNGRPVADA